MADTRKEDGLKSLGAKTKYSMDYAPEVLETFNNKHPDNDYWQSKYKRDCEYMISMYEDMIANNIAPEQA